MAKVANFWINKGVKGFRLDAIPLIGKDVNKMTII
jgi:glycosidase